MIGFFRGPNRLISERTNVGYKDRRRDNLMIRGTCFPNSHFLFLISLLIINFYLNHILLKYSLSFNLIILLEFYSILFQSSRIFSGFKLSPIIRIPANLFVGSHLTLKTEFFMPVSPQKATHFLCSVKIASCLETIQKISFHLNLHQPLS
jgi:hypothetical protein